MIVSLVRPHHNLMRFFIFIIFITMKVIIKESRLKTYLDKVHNFDLTGKVKLITSYDDIPDVFKAYITEKMYNHATERIKEPFFALKLKDKILDGVYLYRQGKKTNTTVVMDAYGFLKDEETLMNEINYPIGLGIELDELFMLYV